MTTLLCINSKSRSGDVPIETIAEPLQSLGPVIVHRMGCGTDVASAFECIERSVTRVVVGGGDGTLNRMLPVLLRANLPLGVVPLGTGNDFARSLSLPFEPVEAVKVIVGGHCRRVDVGEANGIPFLNSVGIGLGPELTKRLDRERKVRLGVLAYLTSLIEVVGQRRRHRATIVLDGASKKIRFMQITVANGPHYGGGMTIADHVRIDDGMLHMLYIKPQSVWSLIGNAALVRFGLSKNERSDTLRLHSANKMHVRTAYPTDVTFDGELLSMTPINCVCIAGALKVFVPQTEI